MCIRDRREYPLKYTEREYTGRETARYSLRLMGREINLYPNSMSPGEGYEERREEHIYQNGNFDGGFIKKTFAEYTETERQRTVSEAVEQGAREDVYKRQPLTLAYVGDCVYELYVRTYLIKDANHNVNSLHKAATKYVLSLIHI